MDNVAEITTNEEGDDINVENMSMQDIRAQINMQDKVRLIQRFSKVIITL
jgi:hypothetical protein